ncbi:MAG: GtrA family protein [Chromatiales bacterium]|nr:GtrA family protein [Chromatiales bacterium]
MNGSLRDVLARLQKPGKFAIVGVINTSVDFGIYLALVYLAHWEPPVANVVSYSTGIVVSFLLNRNWTFSSGDYRLSALSQFLRFVPLNLVGLAISTLIILALLGTIGPAMAKIVAVFGTFLWGYFSSHKWVFSK